MFPDRLDAQLEYMEDHPTTDICGTWGENINVNQTHKIQYPLEHREIITSMVLNKSVIDPSVIFRKSIAENIQDLYKSEYPYAGDYKLWTDLANKGYSFANIPEILVQCYPSIEGEDLQKQETSSLWMARLAYVENIVEKIAKEEEEIINMYNSMIDLINKKKMTINRMLNIIYQLYIDYLEKEEEAKE